MWELIISNVLEQLPKPSWFAFAKTSTKIFDLIENQLSGSSELLHVKVARTIGQRICYLYRAIIYHFDPDFILTKFCQDLPFELLESPLEKFLATVKHDPVLCVILQNIPPDSLDYACQKFPKLMQGFYLLRYVENPSQSLRAFMAQTPMAQNWANQLSAGEWGNLNMKRWVILFPEMVCSVTMNMHPIAIHTIYHILKLPNLDRDSMAERWVQNVCGSPSGVAIMRFRGYRHSADLRENVLAQLNRCSGGFDFALKLRNVAFRRIVADDGSNFQQLEHLLTVLLHCGYYMSDRMLDVLRNPKFRLLIKSAITTENFKCGNIKYVKLHIVRRQPLADGRYLASIGRDSHLSAHPPYVDVAVLVHDSSIDELECKFGTYLPADYMYVLVK
jgi:hypothetical protein